MVYKTPKEVQERKDEKRRFILDTAAKVFSRQGFHETSVKDIADASGVSIGSFYFYFKSKEDLFEILYDEMYSHLHTTAKSVLNFEEDSLEKSFTRAITAFLMDVQKHKDLTRIMMIEAVGLNPRFEKKRTEVAQMFSDGFAQKIEELRQKGSIRVADSRITSIAYIGTIYNAINSWLHDGCTEEITEFAYPLVCFNLQAFGLEFQEENVRGYIEELLKQGLCCEKGE